MGIAGIVASFLSGIFGPLVQWAQRKLELESQAKDREQQLELERIRNEGDDTVAAGNRSIQLLKAFAPWVRYIMMGIWFYPWIMVQFSTTQALKIFTNMGQLPPFYSESCVLIMFAVVGIPVGSKMASTVFESVTGYFQGKRDATYAHEQVMLKLNREAVFADLEKSLGGKMNQATRDMVNKAINAGDDDASNDGTTRA
jgi:hypothetical protein